MPSPSGVRSDRLVNRARHADGTAGITLTQLGFDYRNDSWCGAGAPRFNVYTTAGTYFFFGCRYGVHTPVAVVT